MIACFIRYELDPYKLPAFDDYARNWGLAIPRCGGDAHCGGELLFLGENVIALNGASGRYGPSSAAEMTAVARAFRSSGYGVWSYGFAIAFLAPLRAVEQIYEELSDHATMIAVLMDRYGVSFTAARLHLANVVKNRRRVELDLNDVKGARMPVPAGQCKRCARSTLRG